VTETDTVYVNGSASVGVVVTDLNLNVYPNPVQSGNDITIDCDDFNYVDVYTTIGTKVLTSDVSVVSTSSLNPGIYIFKVVDSYGNIDTKNVLVQ
jgi:hypothetical protein